MSGSGPVWVAGSVTARVARRPRPFLRRDALGERKSQRPGRQEGEGRIGDAAFGWGWEGVVMSVPKEIGHIVLNVTDVERSTRFYRDVVGFQVSRYRPDGTGAFLTCGVVHHNLALFKAPAGARPTEKGAIGLNHFAFK